MQSQKLMMIIWEDWEDDEVVQNDTISDKTQEAECEICLSVKRMRKENIVKEVFKLISEVPFQTLKNVMMGKSQDELGELIRLFSPLTSVISM